MLNIILSQTMRRKIMLDKFESDENIRQRLPKDGRYLPKGLINAYLGNRMSESAKKTFESTLGDFESLDQQLQIKSEIQSFMQELIPNNQIPNQVRSELRLEMSDIADSVLLEESVSLKDKVIKILNTSVIEF